MDITNLTKSIFIGGARSGKSALAEKFISKHGSERCYLATAPRSWIESDPDFAQRVLKHAQRRQSQWRLTELAHPADLYGLIEGSRVPLLIDSVGTWIAGTPNFRPDLLRLKSAINMSEVPLAFVSEEVGLGIHSLEATTREFVDILGMVNQTIAACVGRAYFVVAGLVIELSEPNLSWPQR